MAKATTQPSGRPNVILELTAEEADALATILGNFNGTGAANSIFNALADVDADYHVGKVFNHAGNEVSVLRYVPKDQ